MNMDLEKKQSDIDLLTKDVALQELSIQRQRIAIYAAGSTGFLLLLMAIGIFSRYKYVRRTNRIIAEERDRSEKLLLNILPAETAQELKEKGVATPKDYEMVSVLFTDFKGFTIIAEKLTAKELIEELNHCFFEFDKIIDKHNLEKIKTIGDAYMCAGGIPVANKTNPVDIVKAGLEIREFMDNLKIQREKEGKDYWELRIGIHTGEVVAGVVGKNKFAYDIWGDAVNTASRMESSGIPGQVNISGTTYEFVKDHFQCTYRGKVQAKNKGEIDMYIVENIK
jgi:class 3 adenylate cyclase